VTDPAISPDLPELRLLAQLAAVKPSALAAALNNPEHFSEHLPAEELSRYLAGMTRLIALLSRINAILDGALANTLKVHPEWGAHRNA
jgi:hypothetical protein